LFWDLRKETSQLKDVRMADLQRRAAQAKCDLNTTNPLGVFIRPPGTIIWAAGTRQAKNISLLEANYLSARI